MHGAPLLSSQAALNTGCGYSYVISAEYVVNKLTNPSILTIETNSGEHVSDLTFLSGTTIAIGPGLGLNHDTIVALGKFLLNRKLPIIIDADALTIIADNKWHDRIPPNSILTPHEGEFKKLIGTNYNNGNERLRLLMNYAKKYQCVVVLKGPYTCIATPDGKIYFNSTGNSALAVAGSGDVLTGMIASFHAQGYTMAESAIKGVFYHGLAADLYVQEYDEYSLTPITLISWIKHALAKSQTE